MKSHADAVDLGQTRRRFLLAREQAAQASADHYRAVRKMRDWPSQNGGRTSSGTRAPSVRRHTGAAHTPPHAERPASRRAPTYTASK